MMFVFGGQTLENENDGGVPEHAGCGGKVLTASNELLKECFKSVIVFRNLHILYKSLFLVYRYVLELNDMNWLTMGTKRPERYT